MRVERKREHEHAGAQVLGHRLGWARLRALRRLGARLLDGMWQPAKLGERQHEHGAEGAEHQRIERQRGVVARLHFLRELPGERTVLVDEVGFLVFNFLLVWKVNELG